MIFQTNLESVYHPPPSPRVFRRKMAPKRCTLSPSLLSTNLVNKALIVLFSLLFRFFCFCFCFLFFVFFLGGGREWSEVIFYIIPYVRAFLLIQYFFNWVFFFLPKMLRKPWKKSTCVTWWAFRLHLFPIDIVFLLFS